MGVKWKIGCRCRVTQRSLNLALVGRCKVRVEFRFGRNWLSINWSGIIWSGIIWQAVSPGFNTEWVTTMTSG
jgi:hypothetical protein